MEKILIIEDEENVRNGLCELLETAGFNVISASNGLSGLAEAKSKHPDLIISDIMMPYLDGYGVLKEIQTDPETSFIPFIFLTAKTDSSEVRNGMINGADDYITKPYRAKELLNTVRARLNKQKIFLNKIDNVINHLSLYLPHEVRTPFVSILGYTSLVLEGSVDFTKEELIEIIKNIHYSGKRLHKTMEKFLLFSYLTTLENEFDEENNIYDNFFEVGEDKVSGIISTHFQSMDFSNELVLDIKPATIVIKADLFCFIIEELVENAVKFSTPKSKIVISSNTDDKYYYLTIKNYGRGMTKDQINCLGPCIQFDKQKYQQIGNGLGLAIIKKIFSLYKYKFIIYSTVNEETTIILSFLIK